MTRRLFSLASLLSLLLCLATVLLWSKQVQGQEYRFFRSSRGGYWLYLMSGYGGVEGYAGRAWPVAKPVPLISHGRFWSTRPFVVVSTGDERTYPPWDWQWRGMELQRWVAHVYVRPDGTLTNDTDWLQQGSTESPPMPFLRIEVSHKYAVCLTLVLPAVWCLWTFLQSRKRKRNAGSCRVCSYNLTGNTSGVCPECGTAILQSSTTASPIGSESGACQTKPEKNQPLNYSHPPEPDGDRQLRLLRFTLLGVVAGFFPVIILGLLFHVGDRGKRGDTLRGDNYCNCDDGWRWLGWLADRA